jgi:putative tricarboxylic transport membrane protein
MWEEKMKISKKKHSLGMTVLSLFASFGLTIQAQAWEPTETIKIVVHTPAGTGSDLVARQVADIIDKNKLAPVAVEVLNKTGGGGMNAMSFTASQKADPHFIMAVTNAFLATPLRQKTDLNYEDFAMLRILAEDSNAVQVNGTSPLKTMDDFVKAAKAKPKALSLGVGAIGGTDHMLGYALGKTIGAEFNSVSFDGGGEASTALMGGHVDFTTGGPSESRGQIDAGRIRVLAVVGDKRLNSLPDVPTLSELGIKLDNTFAVIRGFVASGEVPKEAVTYYADLLGRVAATEQWKEFAKKSDFVDVQVGPVEMKDYVAKRSSDIAVTLTGMGVLK